MTWTSAWLMAGRSCRPDESSTRIHQTSHFKEFNDIWFLRHKHSSVQQLAQCVLTLIRLDLPAPRPRKLSKNRGFVYVSISIPPCSCPCSPNPHPWTRAAHFPSIILWKAERAKRGSHKPVQWLYVLLYFCRIATLLSKQMFFHQLTAACRCIVSGVQVLKRVVEAALLQGRESGARQPIRTCSQSRIISGRVRL